jgi:hypothetical protein
LAAKKRLPGEVYRPNVTVLKTKQEEPTAIEVSGRVFVFDPVAHENRKKNKARAMRRKKVKRWKSKESQVNEQ